MKQLQSEKSKKIKKVKVLKHRFNHLKLAEKYPEFAKYITINTKGETVINFKDQQQLIQLNHSIMEYYFSISNFYTPLTQMAPAIGCRLNYLEWVKQLVDSHQFPIQFLYDVGTGYSGIFLFLAWRLYGWKGVGVDTDANAIQNAQQIASANKAPIQFKVGDLFQYLEPNCVVVCNPPFYGEDEERSYERIIADSETRTEGGELTFIRRMISESREGVLYTSLVGRRSTIQQLDMAAQSIKLKQGKNLRYGVYWEYNSEKTGIINQLNK